MQRNTHWETFKDIKFELSNDWVISKESDGSRIWLNQNIDKGMMGLLRLTSPFTALIGETIFGNNAGDANLSDEVWDLIRSGECGPNGEWFGEGVNKDGLRFALVEFKTLSDFARMIAVFIELAPSLTYQFNITCADTEPFDALEETVRLLGMSITANNH